MVTTDTRILDAAEELFTRFGYARTSTRALAEHAGVNEVTLFRRFTTKAGILRAIGARVAEQSARSADAAHLAGLDLRSALRELARIEIESARRFGHLVLRLVLEAGTQPEVMAALGEVAAANQVAVAEVLRQRVNDGELRRDVPLTLLTESFFGLTSSLVLTRLLNGLNPAPADADDLLAGRCVELFLSGAAPPRSAHPLESS